MARRLPPLNSLRAFEAAGRHLSFTKAAIELAVTQAAISHQVKTLEDNLNVALFRRLPRQLELTTAGHRLLPVVRSSFDSISNSVAELRAMTAHSELTVRLAPSFAAKWLSPRLEGFRQLHPQIELSLTHSNEVVNFERQPIDIAVTYGKGEWPGSVAQRVLTLDFFPVCAPSFLKGPHPLTSARNLCHHKLLHDSNYKNWAAWVELAGLTDINPKHGTVMDDTNVLMRAAKDGLGVALGSSSFIANDLASGRLVNPFGPVLRDDLAYYVVCPPENLERPAVRDFRDWLIGQSE
ncbi:MAG: transcriptional regulator GcvA [Woeseiaceae bacterium]|nr:transcriptional regulator GcvA [Woeseiaceae bacterium]